MDDRQLSGKILVEALEIVILIVRDFLVLRIEGAQRVLHSLMMEQKHIRMWDYNSIWNN